jgi:xanthine dehydrogenase YagR molybdenum-binding subunit
MMRIGDGIPRIDGPAKVTGAARFAADQRADDQLYAVLVGADAPAGRIRDVDATSAANIEGVVRVLVAGDLPRPHPALADLTVPPLATRHLPLQDDRVMYQGQPVAMVLAETLEAAECAAGFVRVRLEPASFVNPETAVTEAPDPTQGYTQLAPLDGGFGDMDTADTDAGTVLTAAYTQPARHNNPMEPSAVLAVWDGDTLTVYDSVQHVYAVRATLAAAFGLDAGAVRVISPHTGGGFGAKAFVWPHEILAPMAARVVGRPVKLVLTRAQMYEMVGYQPWMRHEVTLAARSEGTLLGVRHDVVNSTALTDDYVEFGSATATALWSTPAVATSQRVRRGHVNLPTFMRSPIDGPGTWALGAAMDELARAASIDPLDIRVLNHADHEPGTGRPWSSKRLLEAYAEAARRFGWRERPAGGTRDGDWAIGCGLADATQGQYRFPSSARVTLSRDLRLVLEAGFTDIGQGPATVFAQIAANQLGLPIDAVTVRAGDSDLPIVGPTYGSGTTIGTGAAVLDAARNLVAALAELAGWPAEAVRCSEGQLCHNRRHVSLAALMADSPSALSAQGSFDLPGGAGADAGPQEFATRTFGVVMVEVGVDSALGVLRLRRAVGVYSAGRIMNERTARSQMIGGMVWGWGMATMEASRYEPSLGRWLGTDLASVALPVNADIPAEIDVSFIDEFDEHAGPLGAKGIGELSATGQAAAIANAVYDAVGVRVRELPITPDKIVTHLVNWKELTY